MVTFTLCIAGAYRATSRGLRPVSLIFFIFMASWLGVAPVYQLAHDELAWGDTSGLNSVSRNTAGLLMIALFVLAYWIGIGIQSLRENSPRRGASAPVEGEEQLAPRARGLYLWTYVGALVLLSPYAIAVNGGFGSLFASRNSRGEAQTSLGLTFAQVGGARFALGNILPQALAVAAAHLAIARLRASRQAERPVYGSDVVALGISLVGVVLFANPFSNTRFIGAAAFVSLLLAVCRPRRRPAAQLTAGFALLGSLLIYPLANVFRFSSGQGQGMDTLSGLQVFRGQDFDGYQQCLNSLTFVQMTGHSYGKYLISAILYFVPRSIWASKAQPASIDVATSAHYTFTNLSLPFNAEMYVEFGWAGVLVAGAVLGYFGWRLDHLWLRLPWKRVTLCVPYATIAVFALLRGPLGSLAPVYLTTFGLIYLAAQDGTRARAGTEVPEQRRTASEAVA